MREQGKYIYTTGSIRSFGLWETSRFTISSIRTLCSFILFLRFLTLTRALYQYIHVVRLYDKNEILIKCRLYIFIIRSQILFFVTQQQAPPIIMACGWLDNCTVLGRGINTPSLCHYPPSEPVAQVSALPH